MSDAPATPQQKHAWEIAYAPASEAYIKDQSIIRPAFEYLRHYDGVHEIFSGIELESPSILVAIDWDSIEAHEAYKNSPTYQGYINLLIPELAGAATVVSVHFVVSPAPALRAPLTEFLWITPKADEDKSVVATLEKLVAYGNNPQTGVIAASYGRAVETPGTYILVVGWSSVKAHVSERKSSTLYELFKGLPSFAEHLVQGNGVAHASFDTLVGELSAKAELTEVHSALTEFKN
ncbi:hypothetical protein FA95DRAFT_1596498 [Auriscalpium vulgare]|uniref:Uncharacterized protein n=1 Tax=Auriscalpium vulgare TaxID=40419 RepID=A0ACB8RPD3_9AGAM|nr:hypothetical protein FA95DRAFT_1596498 [Auriscalpium vulgare]